MKTVLLVRKILGTFIFIGILFVSSSASPKVNHMGSSNACEIYGKVKFVDNGEDYKVKLVDYGQDVKIKFVDNEEDKKGLWRRVDYGQKYKLKWVDFGEDFKIKLVASGEGC